MRVSHGASQIYTNQLGFTVLKAHRLWNTAAVYCSTDWCWRGNWLPSKRHTYCIVLGLYRRLPENTSDTRPCVAVVVVTVCFESIVHPQPSSWNSFYLLVECKACLGYLRTQHYANIHAYIHTSIHAYEPHRWARFDRGIARRGFDDSKKQGG